MIGLRLFAVAALLQVSQLVAAEPIELVTLDYPPYIEQKEDRVSGVAVDLVRYVFAELEQPVTITVMPWAEALKLVESGGTDGIFTIFKNRQREQFADFSSQMLFMQNISLVSLKGRDISPRVAMFANSSQFTLCVVNKVSYGKAVDQRIAGGRFKEVIRRESASECARLINEQVADLWVNNEFGARSILVKEKLEEQLEILSPSIDATQSFIAFSKLRNHSELLKNIDQVLFEMKQDGRYNSLIYDYFERLREE
ncbi:substrate-binding periplasmic protein [Vibrio paucivorans]